MSGMGLSHEEMKQRIINYLDYMSDKDIREITTAIYNLAKRRQEIQFDRRGQDENA